jgi:hypothetical protein
LVEHERLAATAGLREEHLGSYTEETVVFEVLLDMEYLSRDLLYYFIQFVCHASHPISENPCNNFFSVLTDFGDLSENSKVTCRLN